MPSFTLKLVSPSGKLFEGDVESLVVPGENGEIGVLANHAPILAALQTGVMSVTAASGTTYYSIGPGLLEIHQGHVIVLADQAFEADSKDQAKANAAKLREKAVSA